MSKMYLKILTDNKDTNIVVINTIVMHNFTTQHLDPTYILETNTVDYV